MAQVEDGGKMARVRYKRSSPYSATSQTSWYLDFYRDNNLLDRSEVEVITIDPKYQYRPDLLSYDLYGTPDYWWIFQRQNMSLIKDPVWDLKSGLRIYAPTRDYISRVGS